MATPTRRPLVLRGADVPLYFLTHPQIHNRLQNTLETLGILKYLLQHTLNLVDNYRSHCSSPGSGLWLNPDRSERWLPLFTDQILHSL
jgi:hypothetical protein